MSTITYCDSDDCRNTDDKCKIYDLSWRLNNVNGEVWKALGMWTKYSHICEECVQMWNDDYPNKFIVEDDYLRINKDYVEDEL